MCAISSHISQQIFLKLSCFMESAWHSSMNWQKISGKIYQDLGKNWKIHQKMFFYINGVRCADWLIEKLRWIIFITKMAKRSSFWLFWNTKFYTFLWKKRNFGHFSLVKWQIDLQNPLWFFWKCLPPWGISFSLGETWC